MDPITKEILKRATESKGSSPRVSSNSDIIRAIKRLQTNFEKLINIERCKDYSKKKLANLELNL
jgi:hypothetical protein